MAMTLLEGASNDKIDYITSFITNVKLNFFNKAIFSKKQYFSRNYKKSFLKDPIVL